MESVTINSQTSEYHNYNLSMCHNAKNHAVFIENLCKKYSGGSTVLNKFAMTVETGTMYGLLGSSGCGKTTLLSCIVGLQNWDSGNVLVFGKIPGSKSSEIPGRRLGYMPQDLALYGHLRIAEIVQFYGCLYSMNESELTSNWKSLKNLLELEESSKRIKDFSGGMKRRASLALALIHSPELLVLDEPTVGLDPLLRKKIWGYLQKLVQTRKTTIIITTHYIEEARRLDQIGVMRNSRLIAESSPQKLLELYNCTMLEDAVAQLCRDNETALRHQNNMVLKDNRTKPTFGSSWNKNLNLMLGFKNKDEEELYGIFRHVGMDSNKNESMVCGLKQPQHNGLLASFKSLLERNIRKIWGFTRVMMLTYLRFPALLILILFMPTIQGSLTLVTFGYPMRNMHIGIVNHELKSWDTECRSPDRLNNSCDFSSLSCNLIDALETGDLLVLDPYDAEQDALTEVNLGNIWGYIIFPQNYSQSVLNRLLANKYAQSEDILGTELHVRLDCSQFVANYFMQKHLYQSYLEYLQRVFSSCNIGGPNALLAMHFRDPVYGKKEDDYTFVLPGVIIISLQTLICSITAIIFITDFKQGTLSRARVAGLSISNIVLSHVITQQVVTVIQIVVWTVVLHFVFGIVVQGPYIEYVILCLLNGLHGTLIGLLVGIWLHDVVKTLIAAVFFTPIFLLFGGVFFPFENMPKFWQHFGKILPTTLPTTAMRSIVFRGVGLTHLLVWPGFVSILVWSIVCALLFPVIWRKCSK